jgi:quercetin dioxygenase-like cupin family protein
MVNMKIMNKKEFDEINVFGTGNANIAYADYFTGNSYLKFLNDSDICELANVTFEPGCRNNWHIHHASKNGGQILICTAGEGWYVEEGKSPVELKAGTVIQISPNVKHWHGAKKDSWFSHIALEVPGENASTEWCEAVSDEEYNQLD